MNENIRIISGLIIPLIPTLINQKCMTSFLGNGQNRVLGCVGWFLYYIFLVVNSLSNIFPSVVLLLGNIALLFIIATITKRKQVKQRCIFSLLICTIWTLIEAIIVVVLKELGFDQRSIQNLGRCIIILVMILLSVVIRRFFEKRYFSEMSFRYFLIFLLIPISSLFLMYQILSIAVKHSEYSFISVITSLFLLLIIYVVFEVYNQISLDAELRSQNLMYLQQLDLCNIQAEERESHYLEIHRIRHDLKNHLTGLLGMLSDEKNEDPKAYIQKMLDDGVGAPADEISHTGNTVIDSLVNHKYSIARKENIKFDADVFIPSLLPFQTGHLVIIIGNLLENALDACRKLPTEQRYIKLNVLYSKTILQVCVRNSCLPDYKKDASGRYLTTKPDPQYHGIGLTSVEHAVSCYDGEVMIKESKDSFCVSAIVYADQNLLRSL